MGKEPKSEILVIGAGPAGLTAALELSRKGSRCTVLEKDDHSVGGLARTVEYKGFRFDIGGHRFFTKSQEIENLWHQILADEDFIKVNRKSRIYYKGKFYDYPLKPVNALVNLGLVESTLCCASYLYRLLHPREPERSFQDWVVNRFGDRLFSIFFQSYTEKVWGMKCSEISSDWAAQRIKGLSLAKAIVNAVSNRQTPSPVRTLTGDFYYPRLGPGMMWERTRGLVESLGGRVILDRRVTCIEVKGPQSFKVSCKTSAEKVYEYEASGVINTMALRDFIRALQPPPPKAILTAANRLRYRDFLTVALVVRKSDCFPDNWIYVHDPSVKVARIQNYKNWSREMVRDPNISVLGLEYFCSQHCHLWNMSNEDLLALARKEIEDLELAEAESVIDGKVVRVKKAYPVYDQSYRGYVTEIREWLKEHANLWTIGRNGMHRYNNQDHSMMTGILAARNILGLGSEDPWMVGQDAEYIEERSVPEKYND